jgi:predicted nuclease of predicted toxin-antitoxin system
MLVTRDSDFGDLCALRGFPPKVVWLRLGNCTTGEVEDLLRRNRDAIQELPADHDIGILELG